MLATFHGNIFFLGRNLFIASFYPVDGGIFYPVDGGIFYPVDGGILNVHFTVN